MAEFTDRDDRRAKARAEYERIMTTPSPDPMGAFIESGVIGFVFGEMWRRGVLTPRDRRFITLSCVGAAGIITPIETHVWAALNSDPEMKELAARNGFELINVGTDQMDAFMKERIQIYTESARRLGLGKK